MLDYEGFECSPQKLSIESNEDASSKEVNKDGSKEGLPKPRDHLQEVEGHHDVHAEAIVKNIIVRKILTRLEESKHVIKEGI